ncbi:MAG TPA: hypothetical protein VD973_09500 [Symbiobacteriaceae bacterium]|nr:hypothetical protein [Symbiobacteriaceae bacterium]
MADPQVTFAVMDNKAVVVLDTPDGPVNVTFGIDKLSAAEKLAVRKAAFVAMQALQLHILPALAGKASSSMPTV